MSDNFEEQVGIVNEEMSATSSAVKPQPQEQRRQNLPTTDVDVDVDTDTEVEILNEFKIQLEVNRVQFFLLKNDSRKQLASGKMQFVISRPSPFASPSATETKTETKTETNTETNDGETENNNNNTSNSNTNTNSNQNESEAENDDACVNENASELKTDEDEQTPTPDSLHLTERSLTFVFCDYPHVSHTLYQSDENKRLCIKSCHSDYIFMVDNNTSLCLYIDITVRAQIRERFEALMADYTVFRVAAKTSMPIHRYPIDNALEVGPPDMLAAAGFRLAQYIRYGTIFIAQGIRKTTGYTTTGIHKSKLFLVKKIEPNAVAATVSPATRARVQKAAVVGKVVVQMSGALMTGAMTAVNTVANGVSNSIQNSAMAQTVLRKLSGGGSASASATAPTPKTDAAKEVLKSSVVGLYTLLDESINSSLHVLKETTHATADVVGHKFGAEVHAVCSSSADILDSAAVSITNWNRFPLMATSVAVDKFVISPPIHQRCVEEEDGDGGEQLQQLMVDPMTGLRVLMAANAMNNMYEQSTANKRADVHKYMGMEAVADSAENYMAQPQPEPEPEETGAALEVLPVPVQKENQNQGPAAAEECCDHNSMDMGMGMDLD